MLKKLTTDLFYSQPRLIIRRLTLLLCIIASFTPVFAEVFKPIQLILPGNFRGKAVELQSEFITIPGPCWKIPDTVSGLKRNNANETIVFATGNDSSIFSPLSFLSEGAIERNLIGETLPEAAGLSPNDLEIFSATILSKDIKKRIWTNLEGEAGQPIFSTHLQKQLKQRSFWLFNFIGADHCKKLPMHRWGQFSIDDPARSLRRLAPAVSANDYTVSLAYLSRADMNNLIAELKELPGYHFLIHIPVDSEEPYFSVLFGEPDNNVFKMSLMPGHSFLPLLNIFSKNHGSPRMTLRMLPLMKSTAPAAENLFQKAQASISSELNQTLRVIKTTHQASTSAFTFKPQLHAQMLLNHTGCDVAFMIAPPTKHLNDNVICVSQILKCFDNDRIQKVRLSGHEMTSLFEKLIAARGIKNFVFAGCDIKYLAGRISSFEISGHKIEPEKLYLAATSDNSLNDIICASVIEDKALEPYEGLTLWQVWLNGLKSLRIEEQQITE